ncbi:response regulator [Kamptonema sp. UHCC 0994]|uniref:response regulator n=1 Tax=Kamptonema sp. UHCC 0994 TaxID=3031329 RepID=UPI0023B92D65|nr:response regulator [Kamptonema sp. UHCC 0994]MDF0555768.1 response regulator [Kamptonema sp. UHCC 0994]
MKTVLIVEDNPINWRVFEKIITKRGAMLAKHTEDVEEVLQMASSGEADIILMDICLANSYYQGKPVNGVEITKLLKANSQTAKLPVILVTALGESDRDQLLAQSGADGFIAKPIVDYQNFVAQIKAKLPQE